MQSSWLLWYCFCLTMGAGPTFAAGGTDLYNWKSRCRHATLWSLWVHAQVSDSACIYVCVCSLGAGICCFYECMPHTRTHVSVQPCVTSNICFPAALPTEGGWAVAHSEMIRGDNMEHGPRGPQGPAWGLEKAGDLFVSSLLWSYLLTGCVSRETVETAKCCRTASQVWTNGSELIFMVNFLLWFVC